ncbi:MAG: LCP family protein [Clostridiales bacterium]|nr:LCP family protein [Clostridiales bacterium]
MANSRAGQKKKAKTPAWKVFVTVLILIISVAIVLSVVLSVFGIPFIGRPGGSGWVDQFLEPNVSGDSNWMDNDTGRPVLSGDRRDKVYNFLVAGLNDDTGNNTDTLMLVHFDVENMGANIVQIPRDTYINAGYNFHKINSVFAAGYNRAELGTEKGQRRKAGMNELCEFIETNMAVKIDFTVIVDLSAFENFIDQLGGLHVKVPCDMTYSDPEQNLYIDLRQGEQTLSGYQAMCLVRNRKTYADADYGRMDVQKIALAALMKQVKENITDVSTLSSLMSIAVNDVTTDLTVDNCVYFATKVLKMDMSRVKMLTLPTQNANGYITILKTNAVEVIDQYLNVYAETFTAEQFDSGKIFTNKDPNSVQYKTYLYNEMEYKVYSADHIDDEVSLNVMGKK